MNKNSIFKNIIKVTPVLVAAMLSGGCQDRLADIREGDSLFEVTPEVSLNGIRVEPTTPETRAVIVGDITPIQQNGFRIKEYTGTGADDINGVVTYNSTAGKWVIPNSPIMWKKGVEKKFLAMYPQNLASKTTFSFYNDVYYSNYDATQSQQDILFACYDGNGDGGRFPLNFTHALAALQFVPGTIDSDLTAISSVSIGGFYKKAAKLKVVCGSDDCTYEWTGLSDIATVGALSQTSLDAKYLLIPGQTFSDAAPLTVRIEATVAGRAQTITGTIKQGTLTAGHTLVFRLNYRNGKDVTFSDPQVQPWIMDESQDITIRSREYVNLATLDGIAGKAISTTTANCYVVRGPGNYRLPLVYGNAITDGKENSSAYTNIITSGPNPFVDHTGKAITTPYILTQTGLAEDECTASVYWNDFDNTIIANEDIFLENGYLCFRVKDADSDGVLEGNTVIQLKKKADDTVLWSWQIWVTSRAMEDVVITNASSEDFTILDCNLGALTGKVTYCTCYQWGRRDAFPVENTTLFNLSNFNKVGPVQAMKDSFDGKFIVNNGPNNGQNWSVDVYFNAWNAAAATQQYGGANVKTILDPCPAGYCVPHMSSFTYFFTGDFKPRNIGSFNQGWKLKKNPQDTEGVFFPNFKTRHNLAFSNTSYYWCSVAYYVDPANRYWNGLIMLLDNTRLNGSCGDGMRFGAAVRPQRIKM